MQISKFSLWISLFALCGGLTLQAQDTAAQAAARAALLQKLQELDNTPAAAPAQAVTATPAPVAVAPAVEVPATAPAADSTASTTNTTPATAETPADSDTMPVTNAPSADTATSAPTNAAPATSEPSASAATAPATAAPADAGAPNLRLEAASPAPTLSVPTTTETLPAGDSPAQAAARAAVLQKLQELGGNVSTETPMAVAPVQPMAPAKTTVEQPITALSVPVNVSKEQKLNALLSLYKNDQLTPQQYHEQRAAILAAP
jgi:hypothetical protein